MCVVWSTGGCIKTVYISASLRIKHVKDAWGVKMKHEWDRTSGDKYYWHLSICKNCGLFRGVSRSGLTNKRIIYWGSDGEPTKEERGCSEVKMRKALK